MNNAFFLRALFFVFLSLISSGTLFAANQNETPIPYTPELPKNPKQLAALKKNIVAHYLVGAEFQCECVYGQAQEMAQAFSDMLTKPAQELRKLRYKNYTLEPGKWSLPQLIERYFVADLKKVSSLTHINPKTNTSEDNETFYRDVKKPIAQKTIRYIYERLVESLKDRNNFVAETNKDLKK